MQVDDVVLNKMFGLIDDGGGRLGDKKTLEREGRATPYIDE